MTIRVEPSKLEKFIANVLAANAVSEPQCQSVARNIVWSELVGRENYGIVRIPVLLKRVHKGVLNRDCQPAFEDLSPAAAHLDANNGFGQFAGEIAMDKAIEIAGGNGTGMVSVSRSNFYGTGAYFVQQAASHCMIGFALSNSFPKVAAHGGTAPVLGTNPFAFGAPRQNGHSLLVDFATSSVTGSKVRELLEKGLPIPEGSAVSRDGNPVEDVGDFSNASLLPVGGPKGFGVSLVVEILAGVLTGAGISHGVKSTYTNFAENSNSGHFFIAIDISRWMKTQEFFDRFEALVAILKQPQPGGNVLLPGEIRWKNYEANLRDGIAFDAGRWSQVEELSRSYDVGRPG